jgi:RimJ/RimL family protein N-acetyltransferase
MAAPFIRRARLDEAPRLAAFAERTFRETFQPGNRPEDLAHYLASAFGPAIQRAELEDPAVDTLLLELDETLAGYAQLRLVAPPLDVGADEAIELRRFYVDRHWHGQGLARALMTAVEQAAASRRARAIWLGVWERNARAIAFYRRCGFLDVGSQAFMMGTDPQTDRVMLRPLTVDGHPPRAPERLYSERLVLRRPRLDDAEPIFTRYAGDPEVTRYVSWPRHASVEPTKAFLAFSDFEWDRWPAGPYLIESREDGVLLGSSGLSFEAPDCASTGYVLARDAWGRGYASEALRAMVDVARVTGVRRLYALCHTDHAASARVLEKGGFTLEATLGGHTEFPNLTPGTLSDVICYVRPLPAV